MYIILIFRNCLAFLKLSAHLDENEEDRSGQISTDHFYTLQAIQVFGFEAITKFNYFNAIDCLVLSTNSK